VEELTEDVGRLIISNNRLGDEITSLHQQILKRKSENQPRSEPTPEAEVDKDSPGESDSEGNTGDSEDAVGGAVVDNDLAGSNTTAGDVGLEEKREDKSLRIRGCAMCDHREPLF
jgi:hypothetical protein